MKALTGLEVVGATLLIIAIINIFSFRISISNEINGWRLVRIAMVHANLMASEHLQDEVGIVDEDLLETLESTGYIASAMLYDPESDSVEWQYVGDSGLADKMASRYKDGLKLPRSFIGYKDLDGHSGATYALPVVYGPYNEYGVILIVLSAEPDEEWIGKFRPIYENLEEMYAEHFEVNME